MKTSSNKTNSSNSKNTNTEKDDNILLTSSFYKQLESTDDPSGMSPITFTERLRLTLKSIDRTLEEAKEPKTKHFSSPVSRSIKRKKSYKFDELLLDESLISRKNEKIIADSVRKTPMTNSRNFKKIIIRVFILFDEILSN